MKGYWIEFTEGTGGYCEGESDYDVRRIAEKLTGRSVKFLQRLPYPAEPVIWQFDHPVIGKCPRFCHSPRQCAGRTACPQRYACSE